MGSDQQAHRAGSLKQTNKSHKTGRHRSKGAINNAAKGKTSVKAITMKHKAIISKEQRRNQANQIRKNKREEAYERKRALGSGKTAPFLACLIPLHASIDPLSALTILETCDEAATVEKSISGAVYINVPRFKQRFAFIVPPVGRDHELDILDYMKVCDTTIFITSHSTGDDEVFDKWGERIFNMAASQGIPTPIVAAMDLESVPPKKRQISKIAMQKCIAKILPSEKYISLDKSGDGINVLRRIGGQKKKVLHNQSNRPHLYGDQVAFVANSTDENLGTLQVTGFLRGVNLDVNNLIHIPGLGDYQMSQIDINSDPVKFDKQTDTDEPHVAAIADPALQATLQRENIPDEMDAEQTWPTEEEIAAARQEEKKTRLVKRVPKGMSDYQACWIPDVEEVENKEASDDDDDEEEHSDEESYMSCESEPKSEADMALSEPEDDEEFEDVSVSDAPINDEKYDLALDMQEERETLQKLKEARTDQLWPDELDTPNNVPAHIRFQKYRGLESFRTSPWDVKENLPSDYAKVYEFQNYDRTKRRIIKETRESDDGVSPGSYLTVHVANVQKDRWEAYKSAHTSKDLILYGMLPHEQQMSVVNVVLKRTPDSTIPIKSKEKLIIQCGYRRFIVNPILSQHSNGAKHKYERYFRPGTVVVATFYAPIQFSPAPVLCFQENPDTSLKLVASGSLLSCNPSRVVLKRIVLSGHPLKINRKVAVIRYMFFNKEDVEYFKPIKLRTKCGRLGHIKESLGTHGHMKCYFDGQLKSYDTVMLYLYKRVFPKMTYEDCLVSCPSTDKKVEAMQE